MDRDQLICICDGLPVRDDLLGRFKLWIGDKAVFRERAVFASDFIQNKEFSEVFQARYNLRCACLRYI